MSEWSLAAGSAVWLGVLTSVSPCLMATTVAAISYIARRVDMPRYVLISGLFYAAGQAVAYVALGGALVGSLLAVPPVAHWLQKYMVQLIGPILIVAALFLLELLDMQFGSGRMKQWVQARAETAGLWIAAALGIVFAMTFCPTTAALFFGTLIPLAIEHESRFLLPLFYAGGVALPVMAFAVLIAFAASKVGKVFARVSHVELWARRATGGIFLCVGIYFTLAYTLGVLTHR